MGCIANSHNELSSSRSGRPPTKNGQSGVDNTESSANPLHLRFKGCRLSVYLTPSLAATQTPHLTSPPVPPGLPPASSKCDSRIRLVIGRLARLVAK